jgi:hypothetical protein
VAYLLSLAWPNVNITLFGRCSAGMDIRDVSNDQLPSNGDAAACCGRATAEDSGVAAEASEDASAATNATITFSEGFMSYPFMQVGREMHQAGMNEYALPRHQKHRAP